MPPKDPHLFSRSDIPYRPDIDGLRGIAVLLVVAFHAGLQRLAGGFIGVDIFFVISGFLISSTIFKSLDEGRFRFSDFYARRIRRIFPALITVLLACWTIGWFVLTTDDYIHLGRHIQGGGFISNILLWRESGYFDSAAEFKPLLHLWSLGIEEQYYLLWPLTILLLWKIRARLLGLILLCLISFGLNLANIAAHPTATFYQPQTRFWELLIGGIAAYVYSYKKDEFDAVCRRMLFLNSSPTSTISLQNIKSSSGLLLILIAVASINERTAFPGTWALLPTLGTFLIISAGSDARINRWMLANRALVFVGQISYPLYLWHWPLLSFQRFSQIAPPGPAARLAAVGVAFLLSWLTWRFVERAFGKAAAIPVHRIAVPVLCTGMLAICTLGAVIIYMDGLPDRFPNEFRVLATYDYKVHVSGWRSEKCFLNPEQDFHLFDPTCTDNTHRDRPLVFLWGDSHAADLYPGMQWMQDRYQFRLAQYNASECPPILYREQPGRRYCREINDWVFGRMAELQPKIVILAAQHWGLTPASPALDISLTVKAIRAAGIRQIVIVGPTPEWNVPLPRLLFKYAKVGFIHTIPERTTDDLDASFFEVDRQLKEQAAINGVVYLSPISILCETRACRTVVSENDKTDLVTFDEHHLTLIGSYYVVTALFSPLFDEIRLLPQ